MSVQHFAGERSGRSSGQGIPRVSREVQTRAVLDAIVSTKTFGNATSVPNSLLRIPNGSAYKFFWSFEFFEKNGYSLTQSEIFSLRTRVQQGTARI